MEQLEGLVSVQETDATDEIKNSLRIFGEDVINTKFPNYMDGLKNVTRRIIWFTQQYRDLVGLLRMIGDVVDTHVGGDSSIYGAIIRLAQPFMMGHPIVEIQGNYGKYYNPTRAGQPRYLKARLSDFARDLFIAGIHPRTIPMIPMKDFAGLEPKHLIPKLPTALIFGNLTVGFGYKSYIPMIDFSDICKLVQIFAEWYAKGNAFTPPRKKTSPWVLPSFPIKNLIKNTPTLLEMYDQGAYTYFVDMDGTMDINGTSITLRTVPYGVDFNTVTSKFMENLKDKKNPLWEDIVDVKQYSADDAEFVIEMKRGHSPFNILDKVKSQFNFSRRWTPIYSYMKDDRVYSMDPIMLTSMWYRERAICIAGSLKYKQSDLITRRMTLEAMLAISDHRDRVIEIISNAGSEQDAVETLYKEFGDSLTRKQSRIIANQKLMVLAKCSKQQILEDIDQTNTDLQNVMDGFGKINETIANDARILQKKYGTTKQTVSSTEFQGYVQIGDQGAFQFFDEDDLVNLLSIRNWPKDPTITVHAYFAKRPMLWIKKNGAVIYCTTNPREIACDDLCEVPGVPYPYNACFSGDRMCLTSVRALIDPPEWTVCPVNQEFFIVQRDGNVTRENVDKYNVYKSLCSGIRHNGRYAVPTDREYALFYMCTAQPNVLRIAKFPGVPKLIIPPTGDMYILELCPLSKPFTYLNIPKECIKSQTIQWLRINNPKNIPFHTCMASVNLAKLKKSDRNPHLKALCSITF